MQVIGLPVADEFNDYLGGVLDQLKASGIRVELDASDDRFGKKIRNASKAKAPFVLIAGGDDRDAGVLSFRYLDDSQRNGMPIDEAVQLIVDHVTSRSNADPTAA